MRQLLLLFSAVFLFSYFFAGVSYGQTESATISSKVNGSSSPSLFLQKDMEPPQSDQFLPAISDSLRAARLDEVRGKAKAAQKLLTEKGRQLDKEIGEKREEGEAWRRALAASREQEYREITEAIQDVQSSYSIVHAEHEGKISEAESDKKKLKKMRKGVNFELAAIAEVDNFLAEGTQSAIQKLIPVIQRATDNVKALNVELSKIVPPALQVPVYSQTDPADLQGSQEYSSTLTISLVANDGVKRRPGSRIQSFPEEAALPAEPPVDKSSTVTHEKSATSVSSDRDPSPTYTAAEILNPPDTLRHVERGALLYDIGELEKPILPKSRLWTFLPWVRNFIPAYYKQVRSGKFGFALELNKEETLEYEHYAIGDYPNLTQHKYSETITPATSRVNWSNGTSYKGYSRQYYKRSSNNEMISIVIELYATPLRDKQEIFQGDKIVEFEIDTTPEGSELFEGMRHPKVTVTILPEGRNAPEVGTYYLPGLNKQVTKALEDSDKKSKEAGQASTRKRYDFRQTFPFHPVVQRHGNSYFAPGLYTAPHSEILQDMLQDALLAIGQRSVPALLDKWTGDVFGDNYGKKTLAVSGEGSIVERTIVRWIENTSDGKAFLIDDEKHTPLVVNRLPVGQGVFLKHAREPVPAL